MSIRELAIRLLLRFAIVITGIAWKLDPERGSELQDDEAKLFKERTGGLKES